MERIKFEGCVKGVFNRHQLSQLDAIYEAAASIFEKFVNDVDKRVLQAVNSEDNIERYQKYAEAADMLADVDWNLEEMCDAVNSIRLGGTTIEKLERYAKADGWFRKSIKEATRLLTEVKEMEGTISHWYSPTKTAIKWGLHNELKAGLDALLRASAEGKKKKKAASEE